MQDVETVEEHCSHKDCVYRMILDTNRTPFCNYCVIEGEVRGCKISECTRYRTGIRKVNMSTDRMYYIWHIEMEGDE